MHVLLHALAPHCHCFAPRLRQRLLLRQQLQRARASAGRGQQARVVRTLGGRVVLRGRAVVAVNTAIQRDAAAAAFTHVVLLLRRRRHPAVLAAAGILPSVSLPRDQPPWDG